MLTTILPMLKMGHLYEPPLMSALRRKYKLDENNSISHLKKKNNNKELYSTRDGP